MAARLWGESEGRGAEGRVGLRREEAMMVWVWGKPLSVTEDLLACPRCGAAIPAGDSQQLHHQWHERTDTV